MRLAGESIPASTIAGTAVAEQLVLGVALALAVVALAPVMHLPNLIWALVIVFVLVLAAVIAALMIVLRSARGRLARVISGLSSGQALFSHPRATALAVAAGTLSWVAQIAGIWAALKAFGIHIGWRAPAWCSSPRRSCSCSRSGPGISASSSSA